MATFEHRGRIAPEEGKTPGDLDVKGEQALTEDIRKAREAAAEKFEKVENYFYSAITRATEVIPISLHRDSPVQGLDKLFELRLSQLAIQKRDIELLPGGFQDIFREATKYFQSQAAISSIPLDSEDLQDIMKKVWCKFEELITREMNDCDEQISSPANALKASLKVILKSARAVRGAVPELARSCRALESSSHQVIDHLDQFLSEIQRQIAKPLPEENTRETAEEDRNAAHILFLRGAFSTLGFQEALLQLEEGLRDPRTKANFVRRAESEARCQFFERAEGGNKAATEGAIPSIDVPIFETVREQPREPSRFELTDEERELRSLLLQDAGFPSEFVERLLRRLSEAEISEMSEAGKQLGLPAGLSPLIIASAPAECQDLMSLRRTLIGHLGIVRTIYASNLQGRLEAGEFRSLSELIEAFPKRAGGLSRPEGQ